MNDEDLDDSLVVDVIAYAMYLGWIAALVGVVYWFGVEPLPTIQKKIGGTAGTAAAIGAGVAFVVGSQLLYDRLRARYEPPKKS